MKAELNKRRMALAELQRQVVVLLGDVEDINKRLDEIKKAIMVEYNKIDAALERESRS